MLGQVIERTSAPEGERPTERVRRPREVVRHPAACLVDEPPEDHQVDVRGVGMDRVAPRAMHDPLGPEDLPEVLHVCLERLSRRGGRIVAPDGVDQPLGRDDPTPFEQEVRHDDALLRAAERDASVALVHLERSEEQELHRWTVVRRFAERNISWSALQRSFRGRGCPFQRSFSARGVIVGA
jgi:hypothetical protein